jgi:hypothetical protein
MYTVNPSWYNPTKQANPTKGDWGYHEFVNHIAAHVIEHPGFPQQTLAMSFDGDNRSYKMQAKLPPIIIMDGPNDTRMAGTRRPAGWCQTTVTFELYTNYVLSTDARLPAVISWPDMEQLLNYPQTNISALDSAGFLNWMSEQYGFVPALKIENNQLRLVHNGPAFQLPKREYQNPVIEPLRKMSTELLKYFVVHKENSGGTLQVVGRLRPIWFDECKGVLFPNDYYVTLNNGTKVKIAEKGQYIEGIYTYEDAGIDVKDLPTLLAPNGETLYSDPKDPIVGISDPVGNVYTITVDHDNEEKAL